MSKYSEKKRRWGRASIESSQLADNNTCNKRQWIDRDNDDDDALPSSSLSQITAGKGNDDHQRNGHWLCQIPRELLDPLSERYVKFWFSENSTTSSTDDDHDDNNNGAHNPTTTTATLLLYEQRLLDSIQKGDVASVAMLLYNHHNSSSSCRYYCGGGVQGRNDYNNNNSANTINATAASFQQELTTTARTRTTADRTCCCCKANTDTTFLSRSLLLLPPHVLQAAVVKGECDIVSLLLYYHNYCMDNDDDNGNSNGVIDNAITTTTTTTTIRLLQQPVNQNGETALHVAAKYGKQNVAHVLLSSLSSSTEATPLTTTESAARSALLNKKDYQGRTPLWIAVEIGHIGMVRNFLTMGANIVVGEEDISSPYRSKEEDDDDGDYGTCTTTTTQENVLFLAVRNADIDMVKLLIEYASSSTPYYYRNDKQPPGKKRHNTKNLLLQRVNHFGETILHVAIRAWNYDMCKFLITIVDDDHHHYLRSNFVNTPSLPWNETPLQFAIETGTIRIVELLLKNGANVNHQNRFGESPLHKSVRIGIIRMTKLLLESERSSINLLLRTQLGYTAVHIATLNDDFHCLKLLLEHWKAQRNSDKNSNGYSSHMKQLIDQPSKSGETALHIAAARGKERTLLLLLEYGASVNMITTNSGETVLHFVARLGNKRMFQLLIDDWGANINVRNHRGELATPVCLQNKI